MKDGHYLKSDERNAVDEIDELTRDSSARDLYYMAASEALGHGQVPSCVDSVTLYRP